MHESLLFPVRSGSWLHASTSLQMWVQNLQPSKLYGGRNTRLLSARVKCVGQPLAGLISLCEKPFSWMNCTPEQMWLMMIQVFNICMDVEQSCWTNTGSFNNFGSSAIRGDLLWMYSSKLMSHNSMSMKQHLLSNQPSRRTLTIWPCGVEQSCLMFWISSLISSNVVLPNMLINFLANICH